MENINLVSLSGLLKLGFTAEDAESILDLRRTFGPFETAEDALSPDLPQSALLELRELIKRGEIGTGAGTETAIVVTLQPVPEIGDLPSGRVLLRFKESSGGDAEVEEIVPFGVPTVVTREDVDLDQDLTVEVFNAQHALLRSVVYTGTQLRELSAGSVFYGTIEVRTLPAVRKTNPRFDRKGQFLVPQKPLQRFDGYRMLIAPVSMEQLELANTLAAESDSPDTSVLGVFSWEEVNLDLDGSFSLLRDIRASDLSAKGWIWFLSGPTTAFGTRDDDDLAVPDHTVTITLPAERITALDTDTVPFDVGEATLLNRPDIFAEDLGLECRPFDNPARIVDEKSFATVLRVSDPEIGQPRPIRRRPIGRFNEVEWEGDPTRNQARSLAFGHIVEFRVRTSSNGYSLGTADYSMTLAPRQTRRIVRVDYERRERESRREQTEARDQVSQSTLRDRSYYEAVQAELSEWSRGGSTSSVRSGAVGAGFAIPPFVMGGGAATSSATSTSWQSGGRAVAAAERQKLQDAIRQHGDAIRSLETTVIEELSEEESVTGVSEVVRNINYCHALSVVYYEILRHLRVDTEVGGVSECLFVPLEIRPFTDARIRRHRDILARNLPDRDHRLAMRYLDEITSDFASGEIPDGTRAQQPLTSLTGSVFVRLGITRPTEGDIAQETEEDLDQELSETRRFKALVEKLAIFASYIGKSPTALAHELLSINEADRDRYFQREIAPHIARTFADRMEIGRRENGVFSPFEADLTLASRYRYDTVVRIDFRAQTDGQLTREQVENLVFRAPPESQFRLPEQSIANVTRAALSYSTKFYGRNLQSSGRSIDDIVAPLTGLPTGDGASVRFPLTSYEDQIMQERLKAAFTALKQELSENIYHYSKLIWWNMDQDELFTMLDGFVVSTADPRSIASVVERQPIGIIGNALVFRAAAGSLLDPRFESPEALVAYYADELPRADPMRISLPTGGLFARAHMDDCNACEEHGGSHDWVLDQPDPELADLPASLLESRRGPERDLGPSQFPDTLISLQNAPAAPAPTGLAGALGAASSADSFRDMTGLAGTQSLAQQGLSTASGLATSFGQAAMQLKLAELKADEAAGKKLAAAADAAQNAVDKGQMDGTDAQDFVRDFANKLSGGPAGDSKSAGEEARELAATLGPNGAGTFVKASPGGASVASFDKSGLLAQRGPTDSINDPIAQFQRAKAGQQAARDWVDARTAETAERRLQLETFGSSEYAFWAANQNNPDAGRLTEAEALPGSGHIRQADLFAKLKDYVTTARPGERDARYNAIARSYANDSSAWSAAFISHLMASAGFGNAAGFRTSRSHSHYIVEALINRLNRDYSKPFWLFRRSEVPLAVGDIVVRARSAAPLSFDGSLLSSHAGTALRPMVMFRDGAWSHRGGWFDSHTDMVLDIDTPGFVDTIGGNTRHLDGTQDTVGLRRYQIQADGTLGPEVDQNNVVRPNAQVPWAIIKILDFEHYETWLRIVEDLFSGRGDTDLSVDSFLEVFGEDDGAGGRQLRAPVLQTLQDQTLQNQPVQNGTAIFGHSIEPDFSDVNKAVQLKPIPQVVPSNVA